MSVRLRRLTRDYELLRDEFDGHPAITVQPMEGDPPERYRVTYRLKGLQLEPGTRRPIERNTHVVEVYLHRNYPREKPKCTMHTPIFHPNITDWVCIGDHWAAGETLVDVVVQIGNMIQYRVYNPRSPVDPRAAHWARENANLFPIGNVDLYQPQPRIEFHFEDSGETDHAGLGTEGLVASGTTGDEVVIEFFDDDGDETVRGSDESAADEDGAGADERDEVEIELL